MLTVEGLQTSYGQSQVLFGIDLEVRRGEVVTLLGRNGMGKTTTIRSIMGMTPPHGGSDHVPGAGVARADLVPHRQARARVWCRKGAASSQASRCGKTSPPPSAIGPGKAEPRWTDGRDPRTVSLDPRAQTSNGRPALGRRAADAGDCARADDQPGAADPGRGNRGPGSHHPQEIWKVLRKLKLSGQSILLVDKNVKISRQACRPSLRARARPRALERRTRARSANEYEAIRRFVGPVTRFRPRRCADV